MKNLISAIVITIYFTLISAGCNKSATMPKPAPGKIAVDTFDLKLWQKPHIVTATY